MTDKDGTPVTPIGHGKKASPGPALAPPPITAAELRQARAGLLDAQTTALDALTRALAECGPTPPGISGWDATYALDGERGDLARDLLTRLDIVHAAAQGA